ncbi:hypothetical protein PAXRUDRAFT_830897 [Paxillus rubicundulus Ve08.2h10]|uniref:Secreted protein n=1 Tax=Paxillus rubicundulus Ve08.2h10 TaxID=930991 RepID=A0A0D0D4D5_9AGAM|nr:hypothetical protein PAXRUDRAFT_830897 [Paxillus rubicundulus Ve08.2h10]
MSGRAALHCVCFSASVLSFLLSLGPRGIFYSPYPHDLEPPVVGVCPAWRIACLAYLISIGPSKVPLLPAHTVTASHQRMAQSAFHCGSCVSLHQARLSSHAINVANRGLSFVSAGGADAKRLGFDRSPAAACDICVFARPRAPSKLLFWASVVRLPTIYVDRFSGPFIFVL